MKLSHRLLYSLICAMLLIPALFSGCSDAVTAPSEPIGAEKGNTAPLESAKEETEISAYAAAYLEVAKAYEEEYAANPGDLDNPPLYALVNFDGDETPEFVISQSVYCVSLYTFAHENVYSLIEKFGAVVGFGAFCYLPSENILYQYFDSHDDGYIHKDDYYRLNQNHRLEPIYDLMLYTTDYYDKNNNCYHDEDEPYDTIHYYYGSSELSEEDYASMIIPGDFEPLIGTMTLAELEAALA